MAGERKKPTAAEKGKAVEAALNTVRAADAALLRPRGPLIHDEQPVNAAVVPRRSERNRTTPTHQPATAAVVPRRSVRNRTTDARGTPGSRKRARDDDVVSGPRATPYIVRPTPPSPSPIMDGLLSKATHSVVTVVFDMSDGHRAYATAYRTGFILISEENFSVILTTSKPDADGMINKHFVYFGEEKVRTAAYPLGMIRENNLLILIVQTDKRHEAVKFSCDPLGYEPIFTVCAMSGIKLNDRANAPLIKEMEGSLGIYKGAVGTPRCDSMDASFGAIAGSEKYFLFGLSLHDDIITLENVDDEKHTSEIAVCAPVFRLNGKIAGILFSDGGWIDSKIGLLSESIILCMEIHLGSHEWEEHLKKMAKDWLERENN